MGSCWEVPEVLRNASRWAVDRLPDAGKCVSEQLDCCWTWGLLTLGIQKGAEGAG